MHISQYFLRGDGQEDAIAHTRAHEEFRDVLPAYLAIFENCEYRTYGTPAPLNDILRLYQIYFRDTFYCGLPEAEAAGQAAGAAEKAPGFAGCRRGTADGSGCTRRLKRRAIHALFGKTQAAIDRPYVWRENGPGRLSGGAAGRIGGIGPRQSSQGLRAPELEWVI